jgi:TIR domain
MTDFFISYTSADKAWAEWMGYVLEDEDFSVIIQAWDFKPGSNFVLEMHKAATEASRTIIVLSPDYMKSQFAAPEWAAAFVQDPQGQKRQLVPVVVRQCQTPGLLAPIVHINLADKDEATARSLLVGGLSDKRTKPINRPSYPGSSSAIAPKSFPGSATTAMSPPKSALTYVPNIKRSATDADKRRYMRQAFEVIKNHFQTALVDTAQSNDSLECDFQPNTATEFTAEIFQNGSSACRCRIWQGGMLSIDGISYAEGHSHYGGNSFNESLTLNEVGGQLYLSSLMGMGFNQIEKLFDMKRMTPEQCAEYLWRRFVSPLER